MNDQRRLWLPRGAEVLGGAVSAESEAYVSANTSPVAVESVALEDCKGGALSGVSLYLTSARGDGQLPPSVSFELRAVFGSRSETVADGELSKWLSWSQDGSIVHVSGRLCEGWELWMTTERECWLRLRWIVAPATACGIFLVEPGSLVE